jgi:hypothetical protein
MLKVLLGSNLTGTPKLPPLAKGVRGILEIREIKLTSLWLKKYEIILNA